MKVKKTIVTAALAMTTALGLAVSMLPAAEAGATYITTVRGGQDCRGTGRYVTATAEAWYYALATAGGGEDVKKGSYGPYTAFARSYQTRTNWSAYGSPSLIAGYSGCSIV